jgi:prevent-host-death family protein
MAKKYSIAEARDNLAAIVHELENDKAIEITRRGLPVAVMISKEKYDRMLAPSTGFWDAYKAFAAEVNLAELDIQPSEVFGGLRESTPGRLVDL